MYINIYFTISCVSYFKLLSMSLVQSDNDAKAIEFVADNVVGPLLDMEKRHFEWHHESRCCIANITSNFSKAHVTRDSSSPAIFQSV